MSAAAGQIDGYGFLVVTLCAALSAALTWCVRYRLGSRPADPIFRRRVR